VAGCHCLFPPVNVSVVNVLKPLLSTATVRNIPALLELLPGNNLGFYRGNCGTNKFFPRIEQGRLGRYNICINFPDQDRAIMCIINRVDVIPRKERIKLGLDIGQATVWHVAAGAFVSGKFYKNDYYVTPGLVTSLADGFAMASDDENVLFTYSVKDGRHVVGLNYKLVMISHDYPGPPVVVNVSATIVGEEGVCKDFDNGIRLIGVASAKFITAEFPTGILSDNGIGSITHNWGDYADSMLGNAMTTLVKRGSVSADVCKKIRLSLFLVNGKRYSMCFSPRTVGLNNIYKTMCFEMGSGEWYYCSVAILKIKSWNGFDYPTIYGIKIQGTLYVLDTVKFGTCVVAGDISNSDRWLGPAVITIDDKIVGSGFCEAMLTDKRTYYDNMWKTAGAVGVDGEWYLKLKNTRAFTSSLFMIVIVSLAVILFLCRFIKEIVSVK